MVEFRLVSLITQLGESRKITQGTFEPDRVGSGQSDRPASSLDSCAFLPLPRLFIVRHISPQSIAKSHTAPAQDRGCCIVFKEHNTSSKVLLVLIMGPCTKMSHRPRNRVPTLRVSCPPPPTATETEWIIRETACRGVWRGFAHSCRTSAVQRRARRLIPFPFHS